MYDRTVSLLFLKAICIGIPILEKGRLLTYIIPWELSRESRPFVRNHNMIWNHLHVLFVITLWPQMRYFSLEVSIISYKLTETRLEFRIPPFTAIIGGTTTIRNEKDWNY